MKDLDLWQRSRAAFDEQALDVSFLEGPTHVPAAVHACSWAAVIAGRARAESGGVGRGV